ncbi:MAG: hypothetical protein ACK41Q_11000 [Candidatus Brocadia sp.]
MQTRAKITAKIPEAKRENSFSQRRRNDFSQSISSPIDHVLFLQRTIGNQEVQRLFKSGVIQAKLNIDQPGDICEQEAGHVMGEVIRMPESDAAITHGLSSPVQSPALQRLCFQCEDEVHRQPLEKEGEEKLVQAKGLPGQAPRDIPQITTRIDALRGTIQRQPQPEPSRFPNFPGFLETMERNVGENLFNYGHHLYQISVLYPDRPDLLKEAFARYALGRNVLETGFTFAGFEPGTAEKLSLGTGILFKGINFLREGEVVLDFLFDIGHGLKLETNLDLSVNPDENTEVRKVDIGLGVVGRF